MNTTRISNPASFVIMGSPRTGLSSIYHALTQHPSLQVICSGDDGYFADETHFANGNPPVHLYNQQFKQFSDDIIRGEISSGYLMHPFAISRLQRYNPDIKLIIILRNPAMRTYSHWHKAVQSGLEERSFVQVVKDARESYVSSDHTMPLNYTGSSLYSSHISHVQQYFDTHQILFLLSDELKEDTDVALYRMCQFIGVHYMEMDTTAQNIGSYPSSIKPQEYNDLCAIHREDVNKVEKLTGLNCQEWLTQMPVQTQDTRSSKMTI